MSPKPHIALYIEPTDDQNLKNITNHDIALMAAVSYNTFYMLSTFRIKQGGIIIAFSASI